MTMNSSFSTKWQLASVALALTFALGGCAPMTPKLERFVAPPLGSTWAVARSDSGSYGSTSVQVTTKRGEQVWEGEHVITFDTPGFTTVMRDNGMVVAFASGGKPLVSFEPVLGYAYPLEVGKTMTTDHRMRVPGKTETFPLQVTQKVEAYEDVTVPAGTFKAFKISWSESIGNENVYWISPELGITVKSILTRTAKWSTGPGRRENQLVSQNISK
jgi:hypothetical protein